MKTIYCIALEGNGPTGVDWYSTRAERDAAKGTTGAEQEVLFEMPVPKRATHAQITDLADQAAWAKTYFPKEAA